MKKLLTVAVVAIFAFGATSCSKNYTCSCTILGQTTVTDYEGLKKDEAEAAETACNNADAAAKIIDPSGSCTWASK